MGGRLLDPLAWQVMSTPGRHPSEHAETRAFAPAGVSAVAASHPGRLSRAGDDRHDKVEADNSEHDHSKFQLHSGEA
jgi:hypothetical protein